MKSSPLLKKSSIIFCALAFVITVALFQPSLNCGFVNWDDEVRVVDNVQIKGLGTDHIFGMFTSFCISNYTPLERLSCALDYFFWGLDPTGFHFTNIILHSFNASLIFWLALKIFSLSIHSFFEKQKNIQCSLGAFLAALIFAIHPLRVESVVWISERRDVLSLFWLLLCTLCYLEAVTGDSKRRRGYHFLAWILFIGSLLSKATGVTLLIILLLLDFYPLKRFTFERRSLSALRHCMVEKIPYLVASLIIGLIAIYGQHQRGAIIHWTVYPWDARLANASTALVSYVQKWIFPWPLSPVYSTPSRDVSWFEPHVFLSALWIGLMTFYSLWTIRKHKAFAITWWSYVIMILPFTGLLQTGNAAMADRYTYLATIPFAFLFGGFFIHLQNSFNLFIRMSVVLIYFSFLGVRTYQQISVWKNSRTLWEHTLQEVPYEFNPLNNYSTALVKDKKNFLAQVISRTAVRQCPNWDVGWYNHGISLSLVGRKEEAISAFRRTIELNPNLGEAYFALGNLLFLKGSLIDARRHYFKAIQDEIDGERLTNLGLALNDTGHPELAMKYLSWAALRKESRAYMIWAMILAKQSGSFEQARSLLLLGYEHTRDPEIPKFFTQWIEKESRLSARDREKLFRGFLSSKGSAKN